eukprot:m.172670 g.172670  ORF g.172670 m.172670 type:complete len:356 (+) comp14580_c0_seq15:5405-6472(+)
MASTIDGANVISNEADILLYLRRIHFREPAAPDIPAVDPEEFFKTVYRSPAACVSILQLCIPAVVRRVVMQMLYLESPLSPEDVHTTLTAQGIAEWEANHVLLLELHIVDEILWPDNIVLEETFKSGLQAALAGTCKADRVASAEPPPLEEGVLHDTSEWETMLHFIVGADVEIDRDIIRNLKLDNLMDEDASGELGINTRGFQFVLQDRRTQLWFYLIKLLESAPKYGFSAAEMLGWLFHLSQGTLGHAYPQSGFTGSQKKVLKAVATVGFVKRVKTAEGVRFYFPTILAKALVDPTVLETTQQEKGFIVIESNFRLYAYTTSELKFQLLCLFCDMVHAYVHMGFSWLHDAFFP